MNEATLQTLKMTLLDPLTNVWHELLSIIPSLLGAITIVVIGYFIAKLSSFIVKKIIEKLSINTLAKKSGIANFLANINEDITLSIVLSQLVYYIIIISFIMSAAEVLNMAILADALQSILLYLPNVIASIFILMIGFFIANNAKNLIAKSASGMNIDFSDALGKIVYAIIAIITVSLSINQLEIETALLNQAVSIVLLAVGVALALSLGLGTKELASLIISGNYLRDIYVAGDEIEVNGVKGVILSIGTTKTTLKTQDDKEISISNEVILKSTTIKS